MDLGEPGGASVDKSKEIGERFPFQFQGRPLSSIGDIKIDGDFQEFVEKLCSETRDKLLATESWKTHSTGLPNTVAKVLGTKVPRADRAKQHRSLFFPRTAEGELQPGDMADIVIGANTTMAQRFRDELEKSNKDVTCKGTWINHVHYSKKPTAFDKGGTELCSVSTFVCIGCNMSKKSTSSHRITAQGSAAQGSAEELAGTNPSSKVPLNRLVICTGEGDAITRIKVAIVVRLEITNAPSTRKLENGKLVRAQRPVTYDLRVSAPLAILVAPKLLHVHREHIVAKTEDQSTKQASPKRARHV